MDGKVGQILRFATVGWLDKSSPKSIPNGSFSDGDESHGETSMKNHQEKHIQVLEQAICTTFTAP